ncbi:MAG: hypothetical protein QUS33_00730 [Dehalococcoidia bacterium]|nr:hypothetical protein [Dehalococcoidia bacterium]
MEERFWDAFTVFLIGLGVLGLVLGLCTDLYSAALGVVVLVGFWVIAISLRVYMLARDRDEEFGSYRPRRLYDDRDRY